MYEEPNTSLLTHCYVQLINVSGKQWHAPSTKTSQKIEMGDGGGNHVLIKRCNKVECKMLSRTRQGISILSNVQVILLQVPSKIGLYTALFSIHVCNCQKKL